MRMCQWEGSTWDTRLRMLKSDGWQRLQRFCDVPKVHVEHEVACGQKSDKMYPQARSAPRVQHLQAALRGNCFS